MWQLGVLKNIRSQLLEPKTVIRSEIFGIQTKIFKIFGLGTRTDIFLDYWFGYGSGILIVWVRGVHGSVRFGFGFLNRLTGLFGS